MKFCIRLMQETVTFFSMPTLHASCIDTTLTKDVAGNLCGTICDTATPLPVTRLQATNNNQRDTNQITNPKASQGKLWCLGRIQVKCVFFFRDFRQNNATSKCKIVILDVLGFWFGRVVWIPQEVSPHPWICGAVVPTTSRNKIAPGCVWLCAFERWTRWLCAPGSCSFKRRE